MQHCIKIRTRLTGEEFITEEIVFVSDKNISQMLVCCVRLTRDEFITEEMVFVWVEDVIQVLVYFGGEIGFIPSHFGFHFGQRIWLYLTFVLICWANK